MDDILITLAWVVGGGLVLAFLSTPFWNPALIESLNKEGEERFGVQHITDRTKGFAGWFMVAWILAVIWLIVVAERATDPHDDSMGRFLITFTVFMGVFLGSLAVQWRSLVGATGDKWYATRVTFSSACVVIGYALVVTLVIWFIADRLLVRRRYVRVE